jgi:hypothetical protein
VVICGSVPVISPSLPIKLIQPSAPSAMAPLSNVSAMFADAIGIGNKRTRWAYSLRQLCSSCFPAVQTARGTGALTAAAAMHFGSMGSHDRKRLHCRNNQNRGDSQWSDVSSSSSRSPPP